MSKAIQQIEPWVGEEEVREVTAVIRSGWITEAGKTREFEEVLARYVGSRYASVVSNGTVSLFIALVALGIGKDDEVIVPDFTMIASANAIILTGAKPVFVDIDKETLCLNLDQTEEKITKKTRAIMPVPLNGRSADMDRLLEIAKRRKLFIIEDAAQALGCYFKNKHLGTFGDVGSFSFSTPKVITTAQGGAVVTNNQKLYKRMVQIRDFGRNNRNSQDHEIVGYNFKFTDLQAALGVSQMRKLPWRLKRKKEMYRLYQKELGKIPEITFIKTDLTQTSPWFIDIIVSDPIKLQTYLKTKNIGSRLFFPAIHTTKAYKKNQAFPNSLWASRHGLWVPSSTFLSDNDIQFVCKEIRAFYGKN